MFAPFLTFIAFYYILGRPIFADISHSTIGDEDEIYTRKVVKYRKSVLHRMLTQTNPIRRSQQIMFVDLPEHDPLNGLCKKIKHIPHLLNYILPFSLVFFMEYFLSQGLVI